ncbi:hypothetical protein STEG23_021235 [Scotinomys teguina]
MPGKRASLPQYIFESVNALMKRHSRQTATTPLTNHCPFIDLKEKGCYDKRNKDGFILVSSSWLECLMEHGDYGCYQIWLYISLEVFNSGPHVWNTARSKGMQSLTLEPGNEIRKTGGN